MTMAARLKDGNKLTFKASRHYLYLACGFFTFAAVVFLAVFLPEQFASDLVLDRLGLVGLAALPDVYFILVYRNKRVDLDAARITVRTLLGFGLVKLPVALEKYRGHAG